VLARLSQVTLPGRSTTWGRHLGLPSPVTNTAWIRTLIKFSEPAHLNQAASEILRELLSRWCSDSEKHALNIIEKP
jgi:hypothetical protein